MTTVLAIDTCDRSAGVAVAADGEVRSTLVEFCPSRHSVRLLDMIGAALAGAGIDRSDLNLVAATCGPGSFTGVRVAIATAKAISFSLGIPAVGVSSLSVLARGGMPFPGVVVPVLDARKKQVYACAVDGLDGALELEEAVWNPGHLARSVCALGRPALFTGSGLGPYGDTFAPIVGPSFFAAPATRSTTLPGDLALVATERFRNGDSLSPEDLKPAYCRLSEAEEARRRKIT